MIVPRNRLLIWFAVVVLPFAALGALEPVAMPLAIGLIGLFIIAALADAVGARNVLAGISLELPAISRMSKDRSASLEMRVRNQRQKQRVLRVALALPRELQSAHEDVIVALPEGSEWSRLSWECLPLKRGNFRIETAHLETVSPFGFWDVRKIAPVVSEVRVYPNLLTERKNLAALFLHRGTFGLHAQRQLGKGREFEKLREYVPGDGYDEIHWKATARRGKPITKVFQIERTQEVYVVIDASRLSARKVEKSIEKSVVSSQWSVAGDAASHATDYGLPAADSMLERFVTAALVLGLAAEQQGDLFGLLTFTDRVGKFIRAKNGKAHYSACRDALYGAWLCGICLGAVGMSLHHKLCHVLGGMFNLPHAETHAIVLPHAAAYNAAAAPEAMARVARALHSANAPQGLFDLARQLGLPCALADIGMPEDGIVRAAEMAVRKPYANPRPIDHAPIEQLIAAAWRGDAPAQD